MIKPEEFENCLLLAIANTVDPIAQFSVGMGGRSQRLVKVGAVLVVPLNKQGFLDAQQAEAIEKLKSSKSPAEAQEICRAANIVWIGNGF